MKFHLTDYVLHDVEGVCWDVEGNACGYAGSSEGFHSAVDLVTCLNCTRTKDFLWVEAHQCCTAP